LHGTPVVTARQTHNAGAAVAISSIKVQLKPVIAAKGSLPMIR
jgi:hypothetical protein